MLQATVTLRDIYIYIYISLLRARCAFVNDDRIDVCSVSRSLRSSPSSSRPRLSPHELFALARACREILLLLLLLALLLLFFPPLFKPFGRVHTRTHACAARVNMRRDSEIDSGALERTRLKLRSCRIFSFFFFSCDERLYMCVCVCVRARVHIPLRASVCT